MPTRRGRAPTGAAATKAGVAPASWTLGSRLARRRARISPRERAAAPAYDQAAPAPLRDEMAFVQDGEAAGSSDGDGDGAPAGEEAGDPQPAAALTEQVALNTTADDEVHDEELSQPGERPGARRVAAEGDGHGARSHGPGSYRRGSASSSAGPGPGAATATSEESASVRLTTGEGGIDEEDAREDSESVAAGPGQQHEAATGTRLAAGRVNPPPSDSVSRRQRRIERPGSKQASWLYPGPEDGHPGVLGPAGVSAKPGSRRWREPEPQAETGARGTAAAEGAARPPGPVRAEMGMAIPQATPAPMEAAADPQDGGLEHEAKTEQPSASAWRSLNAAVQCPIGRWRSGATILQRAREAAATGFTAAELEAGDQAEAAPTPIEPAANPQGGGAGQAATPAQAAALAMRTRVAQRRAEAAGHGRAAIAAGRDQQQVGHGRSSCKGPLAHCARRGSCPGLAHKLLVRECEGLRTQRSQLRRPRFPHNGQPRRRGPPREREGRELRRRWEAAGRPALGGGEPVAAAPAQTGQETSEPPDGAALWSCLGVGVEADIKQRAAAERQWKRRRRGALDVHDEEDFYFRHAELLDEEA